MFFLIFQQFTFFEYWTRADLTGSFGERFFDEIKSLFCECCLNDENISITMQCWLPFLIIEIDLRSYIRPKIEFAVSFWNPYTKQDQNTIEKVQHRATKVVINLKKLSYTKRCEILGRTSLKISTIRTILISQQYCHRERLRREIVRCCNQRHEFFNNRIVNQWNLLPDEAIMSVNEFKNKLDKFLKLPQGVLDVLA
ncbi:RNA-directed DNA polymerase from mobile element jockey-like [Brachionus plicatilis]|uniref:RNA-directed DNA polymerase from mobile element jockey-like n=1 Tax=Brachionus plicatilis TaxID=10195 RepID=A0A3M7T3P2_BRAPC|nr:RNA-directed DNA polymerase from mobile element jockey-like [Brachionus plicatilis]